MNKNNLKLLLLSFVNLIAVFLPYGFISKWYLPNGDENCYLWKMFSVDLEQRQEYVIIEAIYASNAIFVVTIAVLLVLLSVMYAISGKKFLEPIIKWYAIIAIVINLIFGYNYIEQRCYKYIHIGLILAFLCNTLIVIMLTEFKKSNWLILVTSLIVSLPSMIIYYRIDIEGSIYNVPCSIQSYIHSLVTGIVYKHNTWQTAIPILIMIISILLMVTAVLGEFKYKNVFVVGSIISIIVVFIYELELVKSEKLSVDLTFTYIVSIVLLIAYLVIDKKENKRSI